MHTSNDSVLNVCTEFTSNGSVLSDKARKLPGTEDSATRRPTRQRWLGLRCTGADGDWHTASGLGRAMAPITAAFARRHGLATLMLLGCAGAAAGSGDSICNIPETGTLQAGAGASTKAQIRCSSPPEFAPHELSRPCSSRATGPAQYEHRGRCARVRAPKPGRPHGGWVQPSLGALGSEWGNCVLGPDWYRVARAGWRQRPRQTTATTRVRRYKSQAAQAWAIRQSSQSTAARRIPPARAWRAPAPLPALAILNTLSPVPWWRRRCCSSCPPPTMAAVPLWRGMLMMQPAPLATTSHT